MPPDSIPEHRGIERVATLIVGIALGIFLGGFFL